MELRPYQEAAKAAFYEHLRTRDDSPCIVIPTGGGKTPLLASICSDVHNLWQGRILILAHVKELLEQAADKLRKTDRTLPVGVYSAGLRSRVTNTPIVVGGIQSVYDRAHEFGAFDLILIDEAHLIPADGSGMYQTFLKNARFINPSVRLGGLTATPYRLDCGPICGPDNILNHVCYEVGVKELIRDGYLCKLKSRNGTDRPDMSGVHVRGGEFVKEEMQAAFNTDALVESACREMVALSEGRNGILVFTSGVAHGEAVTERLREMGEMVAFVSGETPTAERDGLIRGFKDRQFRWLVNVNVLTTGFDATHVDCVVLLRATESPGLYYQMCGRGFRLHPGKENCLVLDYGGNIERHGPIDAIRPKVKKGDGKGAAPVKTCPACKCVIQASYTVCPECRHEFPREVHHDQRASTAGVISGEITDTDYEVQGVRYSKHRKRSDPEGTPTLRVDYSVGWEKWFSEWVCIEHEGFAGSKAFKWWRERTEVPFPESVDDAVRLAAMGALGVPSAIVVREVSGHKFPTIIKQDGIEKFIPGDGFEIPGEKIGTSISEDEIPF